jgi:hypothetical protein
MARQAEHSEKVLFSVIPGEPKDCGRDPRFDGLTALSEVDPSTWLRVEAEQRRSIEGESRRGTKNKIVLDPGSHPAPRDLAGMTT